jgi:hypothetical protein
MNDDTENFAEYIFECISKISDTNEFTNLNNTFDLLEAPILKSKILRDIRKQKITKIFNETKV